MQVEGNWVGNSVSLARLLYSGTGINSRVKGMELSAVVCVWIVGYKILSHIETKVGSKTWVELINNFPPKVSGCTYMEEQCAPNLYVLHMCYVTLSAIDHCWQ